MPLVADKLIWSYQSDEPVLIWREKNKDGRHDQDIFPNFLKPKWRLGIITTMQYFEYWVISDKRLWSYHGDN